MQLSRTLATLMSAACLIPLPAIAPTAANQGASIAHSLAKAPQ